ncbi:unnamed protein product, partial [Symbiodinium microadriaticum]
MAKFRMSMFVYTRGRTSLQAREGMFMYKGVFAARNVEEGVLRASASTKQLGRRSDPLIKSMKVAAEMYIYEPNTSTCVDPRDMTDDNWRTAILAAEDQNFFCAQAASLFMQFVLGFAVSASKVELTVLLDTASQSLQ